MTNAFGISEDATVVTTTHVMQHGLPVRYVSHELDEDGASLWQFHCDNGDFRPEVLMLVRLGEVLAVAPELAALSSLPVGHCARRAPGTIEWVSERL